MKTIVYRVNFDDQVNEAGWRRELGVEWLGIKYEGSDKLVTVQVDDETANFIKLKYRIDEKDLPIFNRAATIS